MTLSDLHTAIVEALNTNEQIKKVSTMYEPDGWKGEIAVRDEFGQLFVVTVEVV